MGFFTTPFGIHWFRRDLRIAGNPALRWNTQTHQGRVLGFFCLDPKFLSRPDFSKNRFSFFLATLAALRRDLRQAGSDLIVLEGSPEEAFARAFRALGTKPAAVSFNRDYEPFARERDARVTRFLEEQAIPCRTERDHLLLEPDEMRKPDGGTYQVFTPFSKRWLENFKRREIRERIASAAEGPEKLLGTWPPALRAEDRLDAYAKATTASVPLPPAGESAALAAVGRFKDSLEDYGSRRDLPAEQGTSGFSVYLKNGSLTLARVALELGLGAVKDFKSAPGSFLRQLVWRDFYYAVLYHHPRVEHEAFLEKYRDIRWENREDLFEAWTAGKTGYPIVDAGMRELAQTGRMHNRLRMIVASFLTKDLLIDWRWGEKHFMRNLLDGDLALNNGGWQWAASTGCDPQPYFRIFNPELQSKKFDPEGEYIRRFVPELAHVPVKEIHKPRSPVVTHAAQKLKALRLYKTT